MEREQNILSMCSYNCRGLPESSSVMPLRPDIIEVFNNNDIISLQETWYAKQELDIANSLMPNFISVGVAHVDCVQKF